VGTIRAFIAADIGEEIRARLDELQRRLKKVHADVRWVKPKNIHLTLAFLGALPIDKIQSLKAALDHALQACGTFDLEACGVGFFGSPRHPRVIWAGVADSPPLMALQLKTMEALQFSGIECDTKPFAPHLTLGRVKAPNHTESLLGKLEKYKEAGLGRTQIASIELIKSQPTPHGANYSVLHSIKLDPRS
jgi:2'-5' RNA ligase